MIIDEYALSVGTAQMRDALDTCEAELERIVKTEGMSDLDKLRTLRGYGPRFLRYVWQAHLAAMRQKLVSDLWRSSRFGWLWGAAVFACGFIARGFFS